MPQSIQDWLLNEGFTIEQNQFVKANLKIPIAEIIGHSLESFKRKAFREGWIKQPDMGLGKPPPFDPIIS